MAAKKKGSDVSKVRAELIKVTKLKQNPGEDIKDYQFRVCDALSKLNDDDFGKLSKEARDWYNTAAGALDDTEKKPTDCDIPAFPGEEAEEETQASGETTAAAEGDDATETAEGDPPAEGAEEAKPAKSKSSSKKPTKTKGAANVKKKAAPAKPATKKEAPKKAATAAVKKDAPKAAAKEATKKANGSAAKKETGVTKKRGDGIADRIRTLVVKQHPVTFEKTCEKLSIPKSEQRAGSYAWTRWNDASRTMEAHVAEHGK